MVQNEAPLLNNSQGDLKMFKFTLIYYYKKDDQESFLFFYKKNL